MTARLTPLVPAGVAGLEPFVAAGLFSSADVQLAAALHRLVPGLAPEVVLAAAVANRAPRLGHVGVELAAVADRMLRGDEEAVDDLPWPDTDRWVTALASSPAVATPGTASDRPYRPLVWDGHRLYLQRYWIDQETVAADLTTRAEAPQDPDPDLPALLAPLFPSADGDDHQQQAAAAALTDHLAVIVGGPGTGKTRTIARLLAAALQRATSQGRPLEVALAAPTGKAANRMTEAVAAAVAEGRADGSIDEALAERLTAISATTIHRLLGYRPGSGFGHGRHEPLPHDLVIIDETSMVSLPLMARLLAAVRPKARVVLVGDPDQLASVEAGTVLADVVGRSDRAAVGTRGPVTTPVIGRVHPLVRVHRFAGRSGIATLADAVREGRADDALAVLAGGADDVTWIPPDDQRGLTAQVDVLVDHGVAMVQAALAGDAAGALHAAGAAKVLAAARRGPNGLWTWSDRVRDAVAGRIGDLDVQRPWYVGRPVLVTTNDPIVQVANGDTGVLVATPDGGAAVAIAGAGGIRLHPPAQLRGVDHWWAMTIHKSQGSEFEHVVVALPEPRSPLLTRELLYTAITRARTRLVVVASEAAVTAAVASPIARASGLADRLAARSPSTATASPGPTVSDPGDP